MTTNALEVRTIRLGWARTMLLTCCAIFFVATAASAAESWRPFLDGLHERGLHDMALLYLDRMADDPRCPADLKTVLDYEAGITLMKGSQASQLIARREKSLDDARGRFEKFLAEHPDNELATQAATHLANLLVERGRLRASFAERPSTLPDRKKSLMAEARQFYTEAYSAFEKARLRYAAELKAMKGVPLQGDFPEKEKQWQGDLLRTRLYLATAIYEIGMTYPAEDLRRREKLIEAAEQYHAIYKEYAENRREPLLAGFHARLWEGRCYRELGQNKKALAIFDELLTRVEDTPASRDLINQTFVQALETLVQPKVHQYATAIKTFNRWEESAHGADQTNPEGLAIKYLAAEAFLETARSMPKGTLLERKKMLKTARRLFRSASRSAGVYQARAKAKLLDPLLANSHDQSSEPTDFASAREKADSAKDRMQSAELQLQLDRVAGKTENRKQLESQLAQSRDEAVKYYRMALALAAPDTPRDQINLARYYLAYLYWSRHDRYDAAVLGEFVARRHHENAIAPMAAKIAMVAYAELYNQSPAGEAKQFAQGRMMDIANYMTERWPAGPEAADAWITLVHATVLDGKIAAALKYLDKLPNDSPRRGEAELMIGRAYWADWVRAVQKKPDDADSASLQATLDKARDLLTSGIKKMAVEGRADASLVAAVHALIQIHLRQNKPEAALKLLDDPNVGLMALVQTKSPRVVQNDYDIEIYKTALRAYVAAQQLGKAEKVMDALEKRVTDQGDAQAAARLTKIYLALGRDLQATLRLLQRQKRVDELAKVSQGLERFLEGIAKRKQGNSFASMAWVAGTFADMAASFDSGDKRLASKANDYYGKAVDVYHRILKRCAAQPGFAPNRRALDSVKVRLAQCLRRLGRFPEALKQLVDVLRRRNRMVDAQIEAAHAYQDWAAAGNAEKYLNAMKGGYPARRKDGSQANIVWGWGKLANLLFRSRTRMAMFYEARYNLALCRFEYALTLSGKEKSDMLNLAEKDITVTQLLSPALGGPDRRREFHLLLKNIQRQQGKEPVGLKADSTEKKK